MSTFTSSLDKAEGHVDSPAEKIFSTGPERPYPVAGANRPRVTRQERQAAPAAGRPLGWQAMAVLAVLVPAKLGGAAFRAAGRGLGALARGARQRLTPRF